MPSPRVQSSARAERAYNGYAAPQFVADHPASTMFVLFAVGVGIGFALGQTIGESMKHAFERDRSLRSRLSGLWQGALPEAVARHLS